MPANHRTAKVGTIDFAADSTKTIVMPSGLIYRNIYLHLEGAPTVIAGSNTLALGGPGGQWAVVKKVKVIGSGTVIREWSGEELYWLNRELKLSNPHVPFAVGDATTANPSIESMLCIPIMYPVLDKPITTMLDTRGVGRFEIQIEWGDYDDINSAASAWTTEPTITVYRTSATGHAGPFTLWRQERIIETVASATTSHIVRLNPIHEYAGIFIGEKDSVTKIDTPGKINNVKLHSGDTVFYDLPGFVAREAWKVNRRLPRMFDGEAAGGYDEPCRSVESFQQAWWYVDLLGEDQFISEAVNATGLSQFLLEFDLDATSEIHILPQIMVRPKAA